MHSVSIRRFVPVGILLSVLLSWNTGIVHARFHTEEMPPDTQPGGIAPAWTIWSNPIELAGVGPRRQAYSTEYYKLHKWYMRYWSDSNVQCELWSERDTLYDYEVEYFCGTQLYNEWIYSAPCDLASTADYWKCPGLYIQLIDVFDMEREIVADIEPPAIYMSFIDCNPGPEANLCTNRPALQIAAHETMPGESITRINGYVDNINFNCSGNMCNILIPYDNQEMQFIYWAESSFGDTSYAYTSIVKINQTEDGCWQMNAISNDGGGAGSNTCDQCGQLWGIIPDQTTMPLWLTTPSDASQLNTTMSYYYLAGMLIRYGAVPEAWSCADGGMVSDVVASQCGIEAAKPYLAEWQNAFDVAILDASHEYGVPAMLLKNIFARESQFWPGVYTSYQETGLGQMTSGGADTLLTWNTDIYNKYCPIALGRDVCLSGYSSLPDEYKSLLQSVLINDVNASCASCQYGIDITKAEESVDIFAQTLVANCEQTARIINDIVRDNLYRKVTYEDMWRFTLLNYNAGAGCLSDAAITSTSNGEALTWGNLSRRLTDSCAGGLSYVNDIAHD